MFGRFIAQNQAIQHPLARCWMNLEAASDLDGVLVVPAAHMRDIIQAAGAEVQGEERVRAMLGRGMATEAILKETGIM